MPYPGRTERNPAILYRRTIALTLLLCAFLTMTLPASAIGETMKVSRGTPQIDGEIDPVWKTADRQKISHRTGGEEKRDTSLGYVSMLWDGEAIYFLFELIDNDFTFDAPAGSELNDCIYLYIDEDDVWGPTWQPGQSCICLTPALGKSLYPMAGTAPADFEMAFGDDIDGHWNIEFRFVPSRLDLSAADRLLMDVQFNDAHPDGYVASVTSWSDELGECAYDSSSWSYVQLRASGGGSGGGEGYETLEEAAASINRTPITTYLFMEGTDGNHNEGPANLWDGNVGTKFCTSTFSMKSVVRLKTATVIDGLIMATANDNASYNGRNPDEWKLQGSTNRQDWEDIVTGDETFFDEVNFTYFAMRVECTKAYRFYRFYNRSAKSGCCQLSEVVLCSTDQAIKDLDDISEEIVPVDKDSLVNYESPARLAAQRTEPEEPSSELPAASAETPAGSAKQQTGIVPGIVTAAVIVLAFAAFAVIGPKFRKED